jgi:hypothetical protein
MYDVLPIAQLQTPPQPFDLPPLLPSLAQVGVQQLPP